MNRILEIDQELPKGKDLIEGYKKLDKENEILVKIIKEKENEIIELNSLVDYDPSDTNVSIINHRLVDTNKELGENQMVAIRELNEEVLKLSREVLDLEEEINKLAVDKKTLYRENEPLKTEVKELKRELIAKEYELRLVGDSIKMLDEIDNYLSGFYSITHHNFGTKKNIIESCGNLIKAHQDNILSYKKLFNEYKELEIEKDFYKDIADKLSRFSR